ncbi:MAG TPA: fused MFS/spermidine synthase [Chthoniobacterales bacterium]|nr:fused MFS/spermidine synthase [Chthoniobacterales bacterium]
MVRAEIKIDTHRPNLLLPRVIVFAVFFLSGFAALLYQVIWQRLLVFFSGGDVYSITLIVTAFMAGLGVGNLAGGYFADRLPRRLNLLAFIGAEVAIMLFAVFSKWLFYDFLYRNHPALGQSGILLWIVLFSILLWPTFFMGVSLPVLAKVITTELRDAAPNIGGLYGINTLGAATGALITSWALLPNLGLANSVLVGVGLNLVCAATLLLCFRGAAAPSAERAPAKSDESQTAEPPGLTFLTWCALYFVSGFVALSLEILWMRLLNVTLKSSSFTFGTTLSVFLAGLGAGAIFGTRLVRKTRQPAMAFLALQIFVAIYAAFAIALFVYPLVPSLFPKLFSYLGERDALDLSLVLKGISDLWRNHVTSPDAATEIRRWLFFFGALPIALIFPATFAMGIAFAYLQKAVQRDLQHIGRRLGALQLANILGAIAGTMLTGLTMLNVFGTALTLKIVAALGSIFLALLLREKVRSHLVAIALALAFIFALFAFLPTSQTLWSTLHGATPNRVVLAEDGSGVSLMRDDGTKSNPYVTVFVNGLGQSWIPYGDIHSVLGALPLMVHPAPRNVAVIGLGSGDTVFSIGGRPEIESILCVEILRPQLPNLRQLNEVHPDSGVSALLQDKRVTNVAGDGRAYLMHSNLRFDIIEADALRPTSAYAGNVFSREYFELLREHLKRGGVAVTWIPTARVHETFRTVFPNIIRFDNVDIGSLEPIPFDPATVMNRARTDFVREYFARAGIDIEAMMADYMQPGKAVLIGPDSTPPALDNINTDLFPRDEFDYHAAWK